MSSKDASLYGIPRPSKKSSSKEISSSTSLAFTSQLSSLISASKSTSEPRPSRARPKKDDIFSVHNKGSKKRALKDLEPDMTQKHSTSSEALDEATWHRSKRKMEEKARLYAAMKRGDVEDADEKHMVDFDRKWAETQEKGSAESDTSSDDDYGPAEPEEMVEYLDEFGRTRTGTRAEAAREQRRQMLVREDEDRARPAVPANIIYGDTVQSSAFNPDEPVAQQMAELAAKRDKSATPPPDLHFDATKEVRHKGVGFMQFSGDKEERRVQMENLERERKETERKRAERERRLKERRKEVDKRRREIAAKRAGKKADAFLEGLGMEMGGGSVEKEQEEGESVDKDRKEGK